jgi:hypothetical protein
VTTAIPSSERNPLTPPITTQSRNRIVPVIVPSSTESEKVPAL